MCRHLAYLGPAVPIHDLLFGASHSLCTQAREPRHQFSGDDNPHGWGAGWYANGATTPVQYRTVVPIWEDEEFAARSRGITSRAFLAAARLASPGASIEESGNAPFRDGPWLFSLNGVVKGYTSGVGDELRATLSERRRACIEGDADSEVLFAMALDRLDAGAAPGDALADVMEHVLGITKGRLNMLLTDGRRIAATRYGNSLFVRGTTVASEPLDDDAGWDEVPNESVLVL
jgi:glutamine amidotransferase